MGADGEPGLQATAAHSLPKGADAVGSMLAEWEVAGDSDTIEPGTRQATVTAASATSSQCHLRVTAPRLLTRRSREAAGCGSFSKDGNVTGYPRPPPPT